MTGVARRTSPVSSAPATELSGHALTSSHSRMKKPGLHRCKREAKGSSVRAPLLLPSASGRGSRGQTCGRLSTRRRTCGGRDRAELDPRGRHRQLAREALRYRKRRATRLWQRGSPRVLDIRPPGRRQGRNRALCGQVSGALAVRDGTDRMPLKPIESGRLWGSTVLCFSRALNVRRARIGFHIAVMAHHPAGMVITPA